MSHRIYGIDLGTTYSCIAYVDEHGRSVVASNAEGELTTPSVVWFENEQNVVVGRTAKDGAQIYGTRVISTIKRSMGDADARVEIDGRAYKPEEISAFILRKLVKDAETITGDTIDEVVITCPAYFGMNEKEATREAGRIADLKVRAVIHEPTAAAIAYGLGQGQADDQNILVYDLGGGTFDITVISVAGGDITVVTTSGDKELGGRDWDEKIVAFLAKTFEEQTGTPVHELTSDPETAQELHTEAERAKIKLSTARAVKLKVRHQAESAVIDLTRETFDALTHDLLERTVSLTKGVVTQASERHGITRIDKLLLVGGATYMPQVIERMKQFPFEIQQFDPNQAVAKGAALYAFHREIEDRIASDYAKQTGQQPQNGGENTVPPKFAKGIIDEMAPGLGSLPKIIDITSKSFGIVVIVDRASGREAVSNLVTVDSRLPLTASRCFPTIEDGQTEVELRVMQNQLPTGDGETIELADCQPTEPIGTVTLSFERPLPGGSQIEVNFALAADGRLSLHSRDLTTHREVRTEFQTAAVMTEAAIEQARARQAGIAVS